MTHQPPSSPLTWRNMRSGIVFSMAVAGAVMQLNSCINERIVEAVAAQAASKDDITRIEGKIDKLYDFLLHARGR